MYLIAETHFVPCLLLSNDKFYIHSGGSLEYWINYYYHYYIIIIIIIITTTTTTTSAKLLAQDMSVTCMVSSLCMLHLFSVLWDVFSLSKQTYNQNI